MSITCEFCNKTYASKYILLNHQKTTKKCLQIQKEKCVEDIKNIEFKCVYCNKNFTSNQTLNKHNSKCIKKLTKDIDFLNFENQQLKKKVERLEIENELYKQDRNTITEIAKQPRQINNNTTQNNNKIIVTTPLDLSKGQLSSIIDDNLSEEHLTMGQKGIAHFAYNNFLKDEEGKLKYVCTDPSRQIFQFKNKEGDLEKDVRASKLTKALCDADIKQKSHQILSEYVMNGEESITTEYIKHYQNIRDMESDNSDFSKELTSLVV